MNLKKSIELLNNKGITAYEIHKKTGLNEAGVRRVLNGDVETPQRKTREAIIDYAEKFITIQTDTKEGVPYYNIDFTASFLEVENNQVAIPDSYISHPFFKGCDYVVRASGQSMAKLIAHGDAIGLIKIENWQAFFPLGEVYAIVTKNGFRMIKVITKGETKDTFTLVSKPTDNKKDEFPTQQIKINQILSIFKVQASSHLF